MTLPDRIHQRITDQRRVLLVFALLTCLAFGGITVAAIVHAAIAYDWWRLVWAGVAFTGWVTGTGLAVVELVSGPR